MAEAGASAEPAEEQKDQPEDVREFTELHPGNFNNMFGSLFSVAIAKPEVKRLLTKNWFSIIRQWYPGLQTRVYTSPPIHFNAVTYKPKPEKPDYSKESYLRFGMRVCLPSPYSSTKNDEAQQRILWAFSEYARKKKLVAFIVSNMDFQNYLNRDYCCYEEGDKQGMYRPEKNEEGELDIVIIDKSRGIFVFEIKSIGDSDEIWKETALKNKSCDPRTKDDPKQAQFQELHDKFRKRIGRQVRKGKVVVRKMVADLDPQQKIDVRGGFILANVRKAMFKEALNDFKTTKNDYYEDLKIYMEAFHLSTIEELIDVTMFYDNLPERHASRECGLSGELFQSMDRVMEAIMALKSDGDKKPMSDDLYEQVVARFVGPLTTVKIYTEKTYPRVKLEVNTKMHKDKKGKVKTEKKIKLITEEAFTKAGAARIMARRFSELVLLQEQIDILQKNEEFVHLEGAPGTGKTLMLLLRVLIWLDMGHMVWVLSLSPPSRSITHVMMEQIKKMVRMNYTQENSDEILGRLRMFMMTRPEKSLDKEYFKRLLLKFKHRATGTHSSMAACLARNPSDPPIELPQDRRVCLVVDESGMAGKGLAEFFAWIERAHRDKMFRRDKFDQGLSIWSASVERVGRPQYLAAPGCTNEEKFGVLYDLKMPLRCPPSVQRALMHVQPFLNQENICCFTEEMTLSHPDRQKGTENREMYAADGLPVFLIAHGSHKDPSIDIWFCYECGDELADYLQNTLRIGEEECDCEGKPVIYGHIKEKKCRVCRKLTKGSLPAADLPLKYNDVMIVATQRAFQFSVPIGKFALAMAKKNLKVAINTTREEGDAPIPKEDVILIADVTSIHGLERAVIVVIPEVNPPPPLPARYRGLLYPEPIIQTKRRKKKKQSQPKDAEKEREGAGTDGLPEEMEKILKEKEEAGQDVTFTAFGQPEEDFPDDMMDSAPVGLEAPELEAKAEQEIQAEIERGACTDPQFVKHDPLLKTTVERGEDLTVTGHGHVEDVVNTGLHVNTEVLHVNTEDVQGDDVEMRDETSPAHSSLCQPHSSSDSEMKDVDFSNAHTAEPACRVSQDVDMETESNQPCGQDAGAKEAEAEPTYVYRDAFTAKEITDAIRSLTPQSQQDLFYIGSRAVCQMILVHLGKRTGSD